MNTKTQAPGGKFLWSWLGTWTLSDKPTTHSEGISNCAPISGKSSTWESPTKGGYTAPPGVHYVYNERVEMKDRGCHQSPI